MFEGFEVSNVTLVPDILFDELLSLLTGAELKVLLYIIRRTLGFKKTSDGISLTQFEKGITTADGRILDQGCGLNRETICKALKSLEERGCIKSEKRKALRGDKDVTLYAIRFKEVGGFSDQGSRMNQPGWSENPPTVGGKNDQGGRKISERVVGFSDLQYTVIQETERQETVKQDNNTHRHEQGTGEVSSLSSKKNLLSSATPEVQALIAEWRVCHQEFYKNWERKPPFAVSRILLGHAETLVNEYGVGKGQLACIIEDMLKSDRKGWHAKQGLHLGSVVNWVKSHPLKQAEQVEPSPSHKVMDRGQAEAFMGDLQQTFPIEQLQAVPMYPDDDTVWIVELTYGPDEHDQLCFGNPDDYYKASGWYREQIEKALAYAEQVRKKGVA